jgi:hypothetical protein
MAGAAVYRVSSRMPLDECIGKAQADAARHGTVLLLGRRSQARQLRRLQAALRAAGFGTHYFDNGTNRHQLEVLAPGQELSPAILWWGDKDA